MNYVRILWIAAMACAVAFAAETANTLTAAEKSAGWRLLFDGASLDGWDDPSAVSPTERAWTVEEGCIKSVRRPRIRGDLVSTQTFDSFEMTFEWRIEAGGNSGVKYLVQARVPMDSTKTRDIGRFEQKVDYELRNHASRREAITPGAQYEEYLVAFEYQLIDDSRHPDALQGLDRTTGALYSLFAPVKRAARPVGAFNQSRVVLRGNQVEHWLNGEKVLEAKLDDPQVAEKLAKRWGKNSKVYELLTRLQSRRTPVALQHHVDEVWFRNIKIRPLP